MPGGQQEWTELGVTLVQSVKWVIKFTFDKSPFKKTKNRLQGSWKIAVKSSPLLIIADRFSAKVVKRKK